MDLDDLPEPIKALILEYRAEMDEHLRYMRFFRYIFEILNTDS